MARKKAADKPEVPEEAEVPEVVAEPSELDNAAALLRKAMDHYAGCTAVSVAAKAAVVDAQVAEANASAAVSLAQSRVLELATAGAA